MAMMGGMGAFKEMNDRNKHRKEVAKANRDARRDLAGPAKGGHLEDTISMSPAEQESFRQQLIEDRKAEVRKRLVVLLVITIVGLVIAGVLLFG